MKVTGLILGVSGTLTREKIKRNSLDQSENYIFKTPILSSQMKNKIKNIFTNSLPSEVEHSFIQIKNESQILDIQESDVYVVFPFEPMIDRYLHALYAHNKPIIIMPLPYSEIFSYGNVFYPYFMRDSREIDDMLKIDHKVFLCKDKKDLSETLTALNVKYKINNSRVLCIGEPMYEPFHSWDWGYAVIRKIQEKFGLSWIQMSSQSLIEYWKSWKGEINIKDITESVRKNYLPKDRKMEDVKKMYLILKSLIEKKKANAFTINCLASVIHTNLNVTPCYALSRLNDEGIVSACEADATTLLNMLITVYSSQAPGFMINPYLFPEDNRLFVSHCTSPRLHSYKEKKKDDYNIYSYFEYPNLSFGLQVLKKPGVVTITGLSHNMLDKMLIIKGRIVRNTNFATCRTQIELEVEGEIKEITENYQGRHWILVYGDHTNIIERTNEMFGLKSIVCNRK